MEELVYVGSGPAFSAPSVHSGVVLDRMKYWNPVYNAQELVMEVLLGRMQDKRGQKNTRLYLTQQRYKREKRGNRVTSKVQR